MKVLVLRLYLEIVEGRIVGWGSITFGLGKFMESKHRRREMEVVVMTSH